MYEINIRAFFGDYGALAILSSRSKNLSILFGSKSKRERPDQLTQAFQTRAPTRLTLMIGMAISMMKKLCNARQRSEKLKYRRQAKISGGKTKRQVNQTKRRPLGIRCFLSVFYSSVQFHRALVGRAWVRSGIDRLPNKPLAM